MIDSRAWPHADRETRACCTCGNLKRSAGPQGAGRAKPAGRPTRVEACRMPKPSACARPCCQRSRSMLPPLRRTRSATDVSASASAAARTRQVPARARPEHGAVQTCGASAARESSAYRNRCHRCRDNAAHLDRSRPHAQQTGGRASVASESQRQKKKDVTKPYIYTGCGRRELWPRRCWWPRQW